ncbi:Rossmann-fold NAD(P)-binding domain-containing protein [Myroides sp. LJL119]
MKQFFCVNDVQDLDLLLKSALQAKLTPFADESLGKHKTLGLVFLNPSLRTRMSTQKAAMNLGINVMVLNMSSDGWALETKDGIIMDSDKAEHIKEAAAVMGEYCDILGLRCFPSLKDAEQDYSEELFHKFTKYCNKPVISLESATRHPLQSFTDLITIFQNWDYQFDKQSQKYKPLSKKPKVVLTWAPHVKALPQAVPNSFAEWMCRAQQQGLVDFVITHPKGYELSKEFTQDTVIEYDQEKALSDADFVYVKNWSSFSDYGQIISSDPSWMLTLDKLQITNKAKVMHCLPVRRDLVISSQVLDSPSSIVIQQASNRVWAAQAVLKQMLK